MQEIKFGFCKLSHYQLSPQTVPTGLYHPPWTTLNFGDYLSFSCIPFCSNSTLSKPLHWNSLSLYRFTGPLPHPVKDKTYVLNKKGERNKFSPATWRAKATSPIVNPAVPVRGGTSSSGYSHHCSSAHLANWFVWALLVLFQAKATWITHSSLLHFN